MHSEGNSLSKAQLLHHKVFLSPIKKSKKRKILSQKENNFVLDCNNREKSKLEQYNYLKDKYLNYCVVKVPKRKRIIVNIKNKTHEQPAQQLVKDHLNFTNFLKSKRQQIIFKSHQFNEQLNKEQYKVEKVEQVDVKQVKFQNDDVQAIEAQKAEQNEQRQAIQAKWVEKNEQRQAIQVKQTEKNEQRQAIQVKQTDKNEQRQAIEVKQAEQNQQRQIKFPAQIDKEYKQCKTHPNSHDNH